MAKTYFTLTGTRHYFGTAFMEPGMKVKLVKDLKNEYDTEAIKVEMEGFGQVGFVANSTFSVLGESKSAGRLYDKIGDEAFGKVKYILPQGVLCEVDEIQATLEK